MRSAAVGRRGPTQVCFDYQWRPLVFENFSLYFFQAGTNITTTPPKNGTYVWFEKDDPGLSQQDRFHPCYERSLADHALWVRSKVVKDRTGEFVHLPRASSQDFWYRYDHYRVLRTHKPWNVPVLYGILPARPDDSSTGWRGAKGKLLRIDVLVDVDVAVETSTSTSTSTKNEKQIKNGYEKHP